MQEPPPPARRYKTTLSCAECRRLKLRCDRVFPCSSCQRRGCASICPDGKLPPSKSIRKDTPSQLEILRSRVLELELELATLQEKSSSSPQPQRKDGDDGNTKSSHDDPSQSHTGVTENLAESLGTLSITGYGKSRFFGTTGGATQWLWSIDDDDVGGDISDYSPEVDDYRFPPEILFLISAFPSPIPSRASPEVWNWINASLPSHMEAWSLFETFYENGAYIFIPLPRKMFIEQVFSFFYGSSQGPTVDIPRGHRLALLLMVFAIAELLDLTRPAMPTGGKRFYFLARAALTLERLYERPTLTAVQVMILMMMYLNMSDHKESAELVWVLSGITLKLSLMLGLHRDSAKFNVSTSKSSKGQLPSHVPSPEEAELRRIIFHEVVHFEVWQALQFGRPSLLHFEQYDCRPPGEGPERDNIHERGHVKGQMWSYGFARECLIPVLNFTVSVKPPKYAEIIKLDAKIRQYAIPSHMHIGDYEADGLDTLQAPSRAVIMLRFSAYSMKEVALLYLHRSWFASAMNDFSDPLSSPFGPSVHASYRSASTIVAKISMLYEKEPALSVRIYLFWGQLFVSCVLGAVVARCPACSLAASALAELDAACSLFEKAQEGVRPAAVLPQVLHLRRKAHTAFQLYLSGHTGLAMTPEAIDVSAELSALGGSSRSHLISSQPSSTSPADTTATQRSSSSPSNGSPALPPLGLVSEYISEDNLPDLSAYTKSDWNPLADAVPSTGLSSEQIPQGALGLTDHDANALAFAGVDVLSNDAHGLFVQSGIPGQESHSDDLSSVGMEPTWQSFMAQMGFI